MRVHRTPPQRRPGTAPPPRGPRRGTPVRALRGRARTIRFADNSGVSGSGTASSRAHPPPGGAAQGETSKWSTRRYSRDGSTRWQATWTGCEVSVRRRNRTTSRSPAFTTWLRAIFIWRSRRRSTSPITGSRTRACGSRTRTGTRSAGYPLRPAPPDAHVSRAIPSRLRETRTRSTEVVLICLEEGIPWRMRPPHGAHRVCCGTR